MDKKLTLWEIKKDNNKKEMIRAARNLFEKKGYHETSLRELCSAVGISKTSFFNYFGSKDELIRIIFNSALNDSREEAETKLGDDANPYEAVLFILNSMLTDAEAYPNVVSVAYEYMLGRDSFSELRDGYRELISFYLAKAAEQGRLRDGISEESALTILEGSFYALTFSKDFDGARRSIKEITALVLKED